MILTKLCFLWTLWLPDMVPQTPDEDPSLNADDVTGSQMLPFTSHSCHQPPVSPDHHSISRMIHCFLQTYKCCNCCMFCMFTPPRLWSNSLSVGSSVTLKMMFIQDPDDWMMTWGGHWSADTGTSGVQRDPGDIQCREHFRYLQPSLTAGWQGLTQEKLLVYRQDLCTKAALLPRPWEIRIDIYLKCSREKIV